jgi:hypothetical protein
MPSLYLAQAQGSFGLLIAEIRHATLHGTDGGSPGVFVLGACQASTMTICYLSVKRTASCLLSLTISLRVTAYDCLACG